MTEVSHFGLAKPAICPIMGTVVIFDGVKFHGTDDRGPSVPHYGFACDGILWDNLLVFFAALRTTMNCCPQHLVAFFQVELHDSCLHQSCAFVQYMRVTEIVGVS